MPEVVEARLGDEAGALILRTDDHPEARGRQPQPGDQEWTLSLVLEDGRTLVLHLGRRTHAFLRQMLLQEMRDDEQCVPPGQSTPLDVAEGEEAEEEGAA
jgi:hypothetical protein